MSNYASANGRSQFREHPHLSVYADVGAYTKPIRVLRWQTHQDSGLRRGLGSTVKDMSFFLAKPYARLMDLG